MARGGDRAGGRERERRERERDERERERELGELSENFILLKRIIVWVQPGKKPNNYC